MLLKMSVSGGILILMIILLRSLAINKLPKRVFVLLWDIALLRLLLPFNLPLRYGIASPVARAVDRGMENISVSGSGNASVIIGNMGTGVKETSTSIFSFFNSVDWMLVGYAAGAVILAGIFLVSYIKEYKRNQTALPVSNEREQELRALSGIPSRIKILVSDRISTPLTFGIISPKIILPKILEKKNSIELKYVLTHELVHIKRADNLCKIVILLAVCLHWFNPFVWMMYILFNRDMELSCDEKVISLWGEGTKKEYALALVDLAEKQYHWSLFSNGFGKNAIQERIVAIMKFKKVTALSVGCAMVILCAAATVFAENGRETGSGKGDYIYSEAGENASQRNTAFDDKESFISENGEIQAVVKSEYFPEYEKLGISYDKDKGHLIYEDSIVGYFKDETAPDTYIRVTDDEGSIALRVKRDSDYRIVGLETEEQWVSLASSSHAEENAVSVAKDTSADEKKMSAAIERVDGNEPLTVEHFTDSDAGVFSEENMNEAVEEPIDVYMSHNTVKYTGHNAVKYTGEGYTFANEDGEGSADSLKEYEAYGVIYSSKENVWKYKDHPIAGLTDQDAKNTYVDGKKMENPVYLRIANKNVEEISEEEFWSILGGEEK